METLGEKKYSSSLPLRKRSKVYMYINALSLYYYAKSIQGLYSLFLVS